MENSNIVLLAGGTGGAKLGRGLYELVGDRLTIIANTADDIEIYRAYVSPDPDLCLFWLADIIDERGWGIRGDSFATMTGFQRFGKKVWFQLGDHDLAIGLQRAGELADGMRLTESLQKLAARLSVKANVLPMSDDPVRTYVQTAKGWRPFQQFMIQDQAADEIQAVDFRGAGKAKVPPEVIAALAAADVIVIGPSNPIISIGPILAIQEISAYLQTTPTPVVAVSPIVQGSVVKGPTGPFMKWANLTLDANGITHQYQAIIDGLVTDEDAAIDVPCLRTNTLMVSRNDQIRLAQETLQFAKTLEALRDE